MFQVPFVLNTEWNVGNYRPEVQLLASVRRKKCDYQNSVAHSSSLPEGKNPRLP